MTNISECYENDGYVVKRSVFSKSEVSRFQEESDRLRNDPSFINEKNLRASTREVAEEGRIVDRLDPIVDISPVFKALSQDERIHDCLRSIFGEPALLMKDKLIWKCPGANGYGCHQDYTGWVELPAPPEAMLTVLIALDTSTSNNGPIELFRAKHHQYYLDKCAPTGLLAPSEGLVPDEILEQWGAAEQIALAPGDVLIFSSLAPHQSDTNFTNSYRRHIYFTYSASSCGDLYQQYYNNYWRYLSADRTAEGMIDIYFQ